MEIPNDYIVNLAKSQGLIQLVDVAQKEAGARIKICDFAKHPERRRIKANGRYESDNQIIWIRLGLPPYVTEYVVAHELGHSLQQVGGYPRVSIRDKLRNFKVYNEQKQLVHPDIIVRIHWLTDGISNILLDPGADEIACTYGLLTKQALDYLRCKDQTGIRNIVLPDFDGNKFRYGIENVLEKVRLGQNPPSHYDFVSLLELVRLATVYAALCHRYNPLGLFGALDDIYKQNLPTVRKLGRKLLAIASIDKLKTADECKVVAQQLIEHLQIPKEAMGVKAADDWIS